MNVSIRKIGNSEGVIIPKEMLERLGLKAGDTLEIKDVEGAIHLTPEPTDFAEQMKAARAGMAKYRVALRELAK